MGCEMVHHAATAHSAALSSVCALQMGFQDFLQKCEILEFDFDPKAIQQGRMHARDMQKFKVIISAGGGQGFCPALINISVLSCHHIESSSGLMPFLCVPCVMISSC